MKIETANLTKFLKKTMMNGSEQILEGILRFEKDGLKITANSPAKLSRVDAWLKTSAFKEYEELGNVGINDFSNVVRVLERFGKMISLKKEGNLLTVSGDGKKVDIELIAENFLDVDVEAPKLEFTETFTISATKLADFIKDVQMNKDATMMFETQEKKVIVSNTGKYKFQNTHEAPTCVGGAKTTFGEPLICAVANLDGQLDISLGTDYPGRISEKTDDSVIVVIVAPRVENNE